MLKLNKKSVRIISIVLLVAVLLFTFAVPSFAAIADNMKPADDVIKEGGKAQSLVVTVLGALKWIGIAISVGMLIFMGIKYVTSSPDGKAEYKKQLGPYVVGLVLIIGASTIVGILENTIGNVVNK